MMLMTQLQRLAAAADFVFMTAYVNSGSARSGSTRLTTSCINTRARQNGMEQIPPNESKQAK